MAGDLIASPPLDLKSKQSERPIHKMDEFPVGGREKQCPYHCKVDNENRSESRRFTKHENEQPGEAREAKRQKKRVVETVCKWRPQRMVALYLKSEQADRSDHQKHAADSTENYGSTQIRIGRQDVQEILVNKC